MCSVVLTVPLSDWAIPAIEDFLRVADIRDLELSPDGTHLAMVVNKDEKRFVIVRDIRDPDMPVVGGFGEEIIRPSYLYWGNNDRLLIALSVPYDLRKVERDREKKKDFDIDEYFMFSRMIAVNKDMSDSALLMEDERRLRSNISLSRVTNFLPSDKNHVLIDAYRNGRRTQYRVDIVTGEAERVTTGSSRTFRFFNDDDGKPRYRFDYLPRSKAIVIYEYEDDDDWKKVEKIYLSRDDEDSIDTNGLIALHDGNLVYRKQNSSTGFYELLVVNSETGEKSPLVSLPDQDVKGVVYDSRTDEIVGYMIEKDYVRHVYFDEDQQAHYDAISAQVGEYNFSVSGYSQDGEIALIRSWGPDDPRSYHLWNVDAQKLTSLGHAYKRLATANLSMPVMTTYKARDGESIRSYLLVPRDFVEGEAHPTIVLPHGGPQARSRATYNELAQFLSTRGYVVIQPNFRGSVGYGRYFEEAGYKQWGRLMQDDLADAVNFMIREGITDPDRVCIVGASYGGYAALMGAIKTPDLYKCAVSLNGVTHLARMVKYDMKNIVDKDDWQAVLFDRIGHPKDDKELLDENSPALHADKIRIPVLLVAGVEDSVVPFSQAKMMDKALKAADADYEFIQLKDSGHNPFYYLEDAETVYTAIEAFLQKNLR